MRARQGRDPGGSFPGARLAWTRSYRVLASAQPDPPQGGHAQTRQFKTQFRNSMSDAAIRVEGLGKQYQIGRVQRRTMLREALAERVRAAGRLLSGKRGDAGRETVWALRDVG